MTKRRRLCSLAAILVWGGVGWANASSISAAAADGAIPTIPIETAIESTAASLATEIASVASPRTRGPEIIGLIGGFFRTPSRL